MRCGGGGCGFCVGGCLLSALFHWSTAHAASLLPPHTLERPPLPPPRPLQHTHSTRTFFGHAEGATHGQSHELAPAGARASPLLLCEEAAVVLGRQSALGTPFAFQTPAHIILALRDGKRGAPVHWASNGTFEHPKGVTLFGGQGEGWLRDYGREVLRSTLPSTPLPSLPSLCPPSTFMVVRQCWGLTTRGTGCWEMEEKGFRGGKLGVPIVIMGGKGK